MGREKKKQKVSLRGTPPPPLPHIWPSPAGRLGGVLQGTPTVAAPYSARPRGLAPRGMPCKYPHLAYPVIPHSAYPAITPGLPYDTTAALPCDDTWPTRRRRAHSPTTLWSRLTSGLPYGPLPAPPRAGFAPRPLGPHSSLTLRCSPAKPTRANQPRGKNLPNSQIFPPPGPRHSSPTLRPAARLSPPRLLPPLRAGAAGPPVPPPAPWLAEAPQTPLPPKPAAPEARCPQTLAPPQAPPPGPHHALRRDRRAPPIPTVCPYSALPPELTACSTLRPRC